MLALCTVMLRLAPPLLQGDPEGCILKVNCPEKRFWHCHAGTYLAETEGTLSVLACLHFSHA